VERNGNAGGGGGPASTVRFGPFELDVRAAELRKNGTRVHLQDQPFQILRMLLDRPGEVVSREEIRLKLWPDGTIVEFDHSINAAIKRLRDTLRDAAEKPRYIETLARRGYRFVGSVEAEPRQPLKTSLDESRSSAASAEDSQPLTASEPALLPEVGVRSWIWRTRKPAILAALVVFLVSAAIVWFIGKEANIKKARAAASRVEQLAANGRYQEAYDLALQ
jgi:DNA-binding winged helix-turn-helix (wHTH) protein